MDSTASQRLRHEQDAQQTRTFTRWWNSHLSKVDMSLDDLFEDIKSGILPIKLLEVLSESKCGQYAKEPKSTFQKLENLNIFLATLKAKNIRLVNIGAEDILEEDRTLVLGLTWTLILRYEIHKFGAAEKDLHRWVDRILLKHGNSTLDGGWEHAFADGPPSY